LGPPPCRYLALARFACRAPNATPVTAQGPHPVPPVSQWYPPPEGGKWRFVISVAWRWAFKPPYPCSSWRLCAEALVHRSNRLPGNQSACLGRGSSAHAHRAPAVALAFEQAPVGMAATQGSRDRRTGRTLCAACGCLQVRHGRRSGRCWWKPTKSMSLRQLPSLA